MDKKIAIRKIIMLLILLMAAAAIICGIIWFRNSHIFVGGKAYPKNATYLDLREKEISISHYDTLCAELPNCQIDWSVPFQENRYANDIQTLAITGISDEEMALLAYFPQLETVDATSSREYDQLVKLQAMYPDVLVKYTVCIDGKEYSQDTAEISVSNLTDEEVALLDYLPRLTAVDARGCTDYAQLISLQERRPEADVCYTVTISGTDYPETTTELDFQDPDIPELMEQLGNLPRLESVYLSEPTADAEELIRLTEAFPTIHFTWEKAILGQYHTSEDTEFDFSGMDITVEDVETSMRYFPNAEKVIMSNCGIDNETMAAFRDKMRSEYKVVWTVYITNVPVRTDVTVFHSSGLHVSLVDEQSRDLKYLEDLVVLDIGHSYIKYIDWIAYMPELKYVILGDNWLKDISPIVNCQKMVYLELFANPYLNDISAVRECKALQDLCISQLYIDPMSVEGMDWLNWLQMDCVSTTQSQREALRESMPNTHIEFDGDFTAGWRSLQNYFDMRDYMGLPYNRW